MGHAEPDTGSPNDQHVSDEISLGPTLEGQIEKTLIRKIDLHILPIVVLLYLFSFLDRVNIGNARLYGLEEDLGLVGNQYQVSVSILFVTYCVCISRNPVTARTLTLMFSSSRSLQILSSRN
jgi:hypothetical protein